MTARPETPDVAPFQKRYPSATHAETALRRSLAARSAGVATPAVLHGGDQASLHFERINTGAAPSLAQMVEAVHRLEAMPTDGLTRFDPFLRIRPRLSAAPPHIRRLATDLADRDAAVGWPAATVIHGDFHPGQCLQDRSGIVWLVDLDDLALGPPEADLGNLAAWMATNVEGNLEKRTCDAMAKVHSLSRQSDPALIVHFSRIATLRRALKLAEKGLPWASAQIASSA
jgi:hypothetical protein